VELLLWLLKLQRYARDALDAELGQLVLTDPVERRGCSCRLLWLFAKIQVVVYYCKKNVDVCHSFPS
jgi:hypothetical protein